MTPERHQQIGQLFHAAIELEPDQRAVFLAQACDGNEALRREVESLLVSHEQAAEFIAAPALAVAAKGLAKAPAPALIGQRIGHYRVLSLLGAGGMGEVYLAQDTRLGRQIALKLLSARFTQDAERVRRFEQEARAASTLNHPNILTIHEIGETDGAHYIVTEFIDGQTLRQRMTTARLKVSDALEVAAQVASAIAAAHEAGIIHRDIKPENVMARPDGLVKVLDFGLAKLTERPAAASQVGARSETKSNLSTEPGVVMGTASYMSPEQARGQKVDHRTDIFSLGVMLYEMIAGRRPFEGATMSDVIATLLTAEPPPLRHYCPEAPSELEGIIAKCLSKGREARYQSAKEVMAELKTVRTGGQTEEATATSWIKEVGARLASRRRVQIAAIAAALIVVLAWFHYWRRAPAVLPGQIKSLAVLPLENLSGDPAQEYFADGMTEALISKLTQVSGLRVISRTSVMRFKVDRKPLAKIARELNVDAVIEGTVRRDGGQVKITARLIQAVDETLLRSFDYEYKQADVLKLQGEVAQAIADEIRIQMTAQERARLASARSVNPQAHEAYLLGQIHFSKNNEQDWKQAIKYFERATQIAPDFALAYARLSDAWLQQAIFAIKPFKEVEAPARAAALQALLLDEQLAEAHVSLGNIKQFNDWDWKGAKAEFSRALELDPGSFYAHLYYGHLLMHLGQHDEAVKEGQIAVQLNPLSPEAHTSLGRFLYRAQRYEEALQPLERAIAIEPRHIGANARLGGVYVQLGRYDEAIAVFKKGRDLTRDNITFQAIIAHVNALKGRRRKARRMIRGVKGRQLLVAAVYTALGDKDEAFRILEKAIEERNSLLATLKEDPPLKDLHSDPRWKELLHRMNFPTMDSGK